MQAVDAAFKSCLLSLFPDLVLHFLLRPADHFFNAAGVNSAVVNQLFQGQAGNFPAHGIETRNDDSFRRIVNDEVDAGQSLQSPDITPFSAYDTPLHFVVGQVDYRYSGFRNMVSSITLNRLRDDFPGPLFRFQLGLGFNFFNHLRGFMPNLFFDVL